MQPLRPQLVLLLLKEHLQRVEPIARRHLHRHPQQLGLAERVVGRGVEPTGARLLVSVDQSDHRGQPRQVPAAPPLVIVKLRHGDVILRRRHSLALCVLLLQGTGAAGGARGGDAL